MGEISLCFKRLRNFNLVPVSDTYLNWPPPLNWWWLGCRKMWQTSDYNLNHKWCFSWIRRWRKLIKSTSRGVMSSSISSSIINNRRNATTTKPTDIREGFQICVRVIEFHWCRYTMTVLWYENSTLWLKR